MGEGGGNFGRNLEHPLTETVGMLEMCAARFLETGLYKVKNNRVQPKISTIDTPQSVKINSSHIATLALLLITNFDVWFFLILLEFSSY